MKWREEGLTEISRCMLPRGPAPRGCRCSCAGRPDPGTSAMTENLHPIHRRSPPSPMSYNRPERSAGVGVWPLCTVCRAVPWFPAPVVYTYTC